MLEKPKFLFKLKCQLEFEREFHEYQRLRAGLQPEGTRVTKEFESESSKTDSVSNASRSANRKMTLDSQCDQYSVHANRVFDDRRLTLMIRNIPNKYDLELLRQELNQSFQNKYDFLNLPVDIKVMF